jgi:hypothetical protein
MLRYIEISLFHLFDILPRNAVKLPGLRVDTAYIRHQLRSVPKPILILFILAPSQPKVPPPVYLVNSNQNGPLLT